MYTQVSGCPFVSDSYLMIGAGGGGAAACLAVHVM